MAKKKEPQDESPPPSPQTQDTVSSPPEGEGVMSGGTFYPTSNQGELSPKGRG